MLVEGEGMRSRLLALLIVALASSAPAAAATRNFTVTGFDRIRVDGPFRVRLTTGVAPFAKVTGSAAAVDGVSIDVQGQMLVVRRNPSSSGGSYPGAIAGPVEISVGTHDLRAAWLNGAGGIAIDKAKAQSFDLSVQGAGSVTIGALTADELRAGLSGSGSAAVGGTSAMVKAIVRGTSTLDALALKAKDVTIGAEGTSTVKMTATGTAKVDVQGLATVELSGRPACTTRAHGSAVVSGCR